MMKIRTSAVTIIPAIFTQRGALGAVLVVDSRPGPLYKYFPDVEAMLHAWHERQITGHLEHLVEVRDRDGDAGERLKGVLRAWALISHEIRGDHDADIGTFLHRDKQAGWAQHHLGGMIRDLLTEAAQTGHVRDDIAPDELASYCLQALAAASSMPTEAAVRRLVTATLAGLRPPRPDCEDA
jgi:AcrR family transcriptional regulator